MIDTRKLKTGQEYYFHFQNYFCTGFFEGMVNDNIHIKNGHYFYTIFGEGEDNSNIFAYEEAFLDTNHIVSVATT